ncbi:DUF2254 domain-containing protein [Halobacillus halophilus]|uniref:DUF2254 domain-containing protein n=1 Tax=Halobacillus halophilus TaxID=1570 RepID=UPI001CD1B1B9|nr:DUF2254 domain-containing protein [Halobacillus halophilus]MCA1011715.1 DUF2254 domain-containing protein [Halobacillus halophilus]
MKKPDISRYFSMTKRERRNELNQTLWLMPIRYIGVAIVLSCISAFLDLYLEIDTYIPDSITFEGTTARLLITTLIGGVLTLSAFTINSLLVALTTLSGQFSSRMVLNFISEPPTQHVLGIFNGSFIYVLLNILFLSNSSKETYFVIPVLSVFITFAAAVTFIYFVNHTSTWLQVHNITSNMKNTTKNTLRESLLKETEPYRVRDEQFIDRITNNSEATTIMSKDSGHIQSADFKKIIDQAKADDVVIELRASIGEFILDNTPLFDYWQGSGPVDESKYNKLVRVDAKKTEIQDLEFGLEKLVEVAVKAIGNNDPLTVNNTLYQITDLLKEIGNATSFSPFLVDDENHVRLKLKYDGFDYFLFKSFGYIREYAGKNSTVIITIFEMLSLLAQSMDSKVHDEIWKFAEQTIKGYQQFTLYEVDCYYIVRNLEEVALHTNHSDGYEELKDILPKRIYTC